MSTNIQDGVIDVVGKTPTVYLSRLSKVLGGNVYAKLEFLNPGGSHKTRVALSMILASEQNGDLGHNGRRTIIEPTGGNTGIGIAMIGQLRGYDVILVVPDNYSKRKQEILRFMGADIRLSDSSQGNNSHGELAINLCISNPDLVLLNQIANPANPEIHRLTTAPEIISSLNNTCIQALVAGIGTGGHITGIGETLKLHWPNLHVFGVQPDGCDLLSDKFVPHQIQGLAVGLIPPILNRTIITDMVSVSYDQAIDGIHLLLNQEGIPAGISSGANIAACGQLIQAGYTDLLTVIYDRADSYIEDIGLVLPNDHSCPVGWKPTE